MVLTADERRKMAAEKRRQRLLNSGSSRLNVIAGDHHVPGLDIKSPAQARKRVKN